MAGWLQEFIGINYSQARMKQFRDMVSVLPKALTGSLYTPFIEFIVGGIKFATYESNDYFMQMSCTFSGTGLDVANQYSIQLAYMPKPNQDPNFIDEALAGVTADNKPVTIRFGYNGIPGYNLLSSTYKCLITGYTVTIQNNYFYYTINCVSQGTMYREQRFNFPRVPNIDPINWIYQCWTGNIKGLESLSDQYDLKIDQDAYGHVEKMDIGYNKDSEGNVTNNDSALNDVTVFEFLDTVLYNIKDTDNDNAVYWYELVDTKEKQTVVIHRTVIESEKDLSGLATFTFDWGGNHQDNSTNNLILSFETEYKGEVNIAMTEDIFSKKYAIDSEGRKLTAMGYFEYLVPDYVRQDYYRDAKFWSRSTLWAYNAQMELLGIPADIPIGAYIEVNPLIYGRKHHTAGIYIITGARCDISANGFRTNLSLTKVNVDAELKWFKYQNSNTNSQTIYTDYLNDITNRYYMNTKGVISVINNQQTIETTGVTFSGADYTAIYIDPTDPNNPNYNNTSYSDYDDHIPTSREG